MRGFLIRMLVAALGIWVASEIVPGVSVTGAGPVFLAAILLGVVNALVRPIVVFATFPLTLVTLGLFLLVINAAMFGLVASLIDDFRVAGFGSALLGSLVVSAISWVASWYIAPSGRVQGLHVEMRHRRR